MTLVRTLRTVPHPDGSNRPAEGFFIWTPTARRVIPGTTDEVVEAVGFAVELVEGQFEVDPAATDANWVWRVDEKIAGLRPKTIYVMVPPEGPVDYNKLVRVTPGATFQPTTPAANIWYAYVDDLALQAEQAKQSAQIMEQNQIVSASLNEEGHLIFTKNNGSTIDAGRIVPNISIGIVESGD